MLHMKSSKEAADITRQMRDEPQRWLRLQDSELLLFSQQPEVVAQEADVEVRFNVPENSARLLLQRIAKTNSPSAVVGR